MKRHGRELERQADDAVFSLTDAKGHTVAVPAQKVAYLYFTSEVGRKVGFGLGG